MPSFSSPSSIRVASDDHALHLKITHNLVHGSPSDAVHALKRRVPKECDVLWLSDLTISLSGSLDGRKVPAHDIARSGLVQHLQTQLKANADQLGLNNVSRPFIDDADGLTKFTLTPSRPLPHASQPHANLVSLHLAYIWRTIAGRTKSGRLAEEVNPFSQTVFLPAEALLHRVTEQFLIYHLVGRYPLIFGHWCKRLDLEMQYFPSIAQSILEIMTRSNNRGFVSKCKRLLKVAGSHHRFVHQISIAALSSCADAGASDISEKEMDDPPATPVLTDEQILCQSLEQLFRVGVPQRRFKPAATPQFVSPPQDDDESLLQCVDVGIDCEAPWTELVEISALPGTLVANPYPTSQEDMDVFATEDWPEERMWHLHDAETSLGECEWDTQLDESLINASISTRSPQGCTFALYHHSDVDYREREPAGSGLRCDASELARLEDSETSALIATLTRSPADPHYSQNYEQLTRTCRVDSEGFETVDIWSESEEILDINEVTAMDVNLDWV